MELMILQSEEALYYYFKKFLFKDAKAVQLDGSTKKKSNNQVYIVFKYSIDGKKYKLFGDLSRKSMQSFVDLTEEHGSPAIVLKEFDDGGKNPTLILANSNEPGGWRCAPYTSKASDRLKKAA